MQYTPFFAVQYNYEVIKKWKIKIQRERLEIRVPIEILEKIDKYKEEQSIVTRTSAILELIRKRIERKNSLPSDQGGFILYRVLSILPVSFKPSPCGKDESKNKLICNFVNYRCEATV
ncbi:hypothetical protein GCM10020331_010830 [Ectobacillus funiculus]